MTSTPSARSRVAKPRTHVRCSSLSHEYEINVVGVWSMCRPIRGLCLPNAKAQLRATYQLARWSLRTVRASRAATSNSILQSPVSCSDTLGGIALAIPLCERFDIGNRDAPRRDLVAVLALQPDRLEQFIGNDLGIEYGSKRLAPIAGQELFRDQDDFTLPRHCPPELPGD